MSLMYTLVSKDGDEFQISAKALQQSKTLANLIGHCGIFPEEEKMDPIPVSNIHSKYLEMIIRWCEHHKDIKFNNEEIDPQNIEVPSWDAQFLPTDNEDLFQLIIAVNYLDIAELMSYCCHSVSLLAKGKSPDHLRILFGIPSDAEDEENGYAEEEANKARVDKKAAK